MPSRLAYCLLVWTCRSAVSAVEIRTVGRLDFVVGVPRLVHEHKIHEQGNHYADRAAGRKRRIPQNTRRRGIEIIILVWIIGVGKKVYRCQLNITCIIPFLYKD
jgi:hypothetical protein